MNKFFKILITILVVLLIAFLLVSFLSPKQLKVKQELSVDAPVSVCFNLVNDLSKWPLWSPWEKLDSNVVHSYTDKTYGVGAKWTWKGNEKMGEGAQTIVASAQNDSIRMALEFSGVDGESYSNWQFDRSGDQTLISWDFVGSETPFLFRIFNLIMKGALKKSYKEGLSKLKAIAEKRSNEKIYRGYTVSETIQEEKYYIMRRKEVDFKNMQQFYAQNLGALFAKVQSAGIEMKGMPSGLFFEYDELRKIADMAAAIPLSEPAEFKDADAYTVPSGRAVQVDYMGDYSGLSEAHTAIDEYLKDYELLHIYPVIEEYKTDPGQESDPSKWLTRITYYIQE